MATDSTVVSPTGSRLEVEDLGGSSLERLQALLAESRAASSSTGASGAPEERAKQLEAVLEQLPELFKRALIRIEERSQESLQQLDMNRGAEQEERLTNIEARLDEIAEQVRLWRSTRAPAESAVEEPVEVGGGRRFLWEAVLAAVLAVSFLTVLWSVLGGAG